MTPNTRAPIADTVFRVLLSGIFVTAGWAHLVRPDDVVARLLAAPRAHLATAVAPAELLVGATGVVLLVGGLALLLGLKTRVAAVVLAVCLVPITVTVQLSPERLGPLFKNIALLGGLIHFMFVDATAHRWSCDRWVQLRGEGVAS